MTENAFIQIPEGLAAHFSFSCSLTASPCDLIRRVIGLSPDMSGLEKRVFQETRRYCHSLKAGSYMDKCHLQSIQIELKGISQREK
jgi:hypothetical protein